MDLVGLVSEIVRTRHDAAYLGDRAEQAGHPASKATYGELSKKLGKLADLLAAEERGEILRNKGAMREVTPL